jgi:hypothetical protein
MRNRKEFLIAHDGGGNFLPLFIFHDVDLDRLLKRYGNDYYIAYCPLIGHWSIYRINMVTKEASPMIYISDKDEFGYMYVQRILQEAKWQTDMVRGRIAKFIDMAEKSMKERETKIKEEMKEEVIKIMEKPERLII